MSALRKLTSSASIKRPRQSTPTSSSQGLRLFWLDNDFNNKHSQNSLRELQQIVDIIETYTDVDKCIMAINSLSNERLCLISCGSLGETTVPVIHNRPQVDTIYIFCQNRTRHEQWARNWSKVKGVYTDFDLICKSLKQTRQDQGQDLVSISFVGANDVSTQNLNGLDKSYMYTQILKEIFLTINFEQRHFREFLNHCRAHSRGTLEDEEIIKQISQNYQQRNAIYLYTQETFLYSMINRDLRTMNVDAMIKTAVFIRDLHNQIARLHSQEYGRHRPLELLKLYRSQSLSNEDFDKLSKSNGGLLSFNQFLSTSKKKEVSLELIRKKEQTTDSVQILFVMTIDPSKSSTPFANISSQSNFQKEEEILFSMHAIFRIEKIEPTDSCDLLKKVYLTLTNENDQQLQQLTECLRNETEGSTGWYRLGKLMLKLGQYTKAESLYQILLNENPNEHERAHIHCQLGLSKYHQGKYSEAISLFEKSLDLSRHTSSDERNVAECYNGMGLVHCKQADYSRALRYYKRALEKRKNILSINHSDISELYNNIAYVYQQLGEHDAAIDSYNKAFDIYQKNLPPNHPDFAAYYNNVGLICLKDLDYSTALGYLQKALEIYRNTLPENHPSLATLYNNMGMIYVEMNNLDLARSYYEKALEILQKSFSSTHSDLAAANVNIGSLYEKMKEYSKALSCHEKALEILKKTLPSNHPDLARCYGHIGVVYFRMGQQTNAIAFCEHAVRIAEKVTPPDQQLIQSFKNNLECVKKNA
ncbi:unnamed protein product [Adineta ricciae]|uniref:ADP ribosyltransferase domain-containing protein n=1 Tax=Adineta ricciae TaxID=249248 RepID=A0A814RA60_ADIRI|nr:unnamed protein product [Adineta ricciae]CAF1224000.1 unnamed protein product [Adineta ricciae]